MYTYREKIDSEENGKDVLFYTGIEREVSIIYYIFLFRLYVIDIAYEYNSTSSFENGYIYIHCQ